MTARNLYVFSISISFFLLSGCKQWTTHEYSGSYQSNIDGQDKQGQITDRRSYFRYDTLADGTRWWKFGVASVNSYDFSCPGSESTFSRPANAFLAILSKSPVDRDAGPLQGTEQDYELWWIIDHGGNKEHAYITRGKTLDTYRADLEAAGWTQARVPFSFMYQAPDRFGITLDLQETNDKTGEQLALEGRFYTVLHQGFYRRKYNFLKGMWVEVPRSVSSKTWPE